MGLLQRLHLRPSDSSASTSAEKGRRLPLFRRMRASQAASETPSGRPLRLPAHLLADILLSDPWSHRPPQLLEICRGNGALSAEVFRDPLRIEAPLDVFSDPVDAYRDRAARLQEWERNERPLPRVKDRVFREWQQMPVSERNSFDPMVKMLLRFRDSTSMRKFSQPYQKLLPLVREATQSAYGQRLFMAHAAPYQIKLFEHSFSQLRDARLMKPILEAGLFRFVFFVANDLINETGVFARGLYAEQDPKGTDSWLAQVIRLSATIPIHIVAQDLWPAFESILRERAVLPAIAHALGITEDEVIALDDQARQSTLLAVRGLSAVRRSISYGKAKEFDLSILDDRLDSPELQQMYGPSRRAAFVANYVQHEYFQDSLYHAVQYLAQLTAPVYHYGQT